MVISIVLTLAGLISVAPTDGTREAVRSIYADSLKQL